METNDKKLDRLTKELVELASDKGTPDGVACAMIDQKIEEILDVMEEDGDDSELLHAMACSGKRSYEYDAETFNEVAATAYRKMLEWKSEDPSIETAVVTTWEKCDEGQELCELLVRQDGTFTMTYAPFPMLEGRTEKIEL